MSALTENAFILLNEVGAIEAVNISHAVKRVTIEYTTTSGMTGAIRLKKGEIKHYGMPSALRLLRRAGFKEVVVCL